MADDSQPTGVLFADICDSSRLYEALGDDDARQLVTRVLDELSQVAETHEGTVVDRIGDELMCTFPSVETTALAAMELQRRVKDLNETDELAAPVSLRVGFHFGDIIVDGARVFGETVYTANRMAELAHGQQVLASEETIELLRPRMTLLTRFVDHTTIKGKRGRFAFHELLWDLAGVTVGYGVTVPRPVSSSEIELRYGDRSIRLNDTRPVLTIGRGADCDLVVDHRSVSRHHGRIEQRKGYFTFTDHSTNGTQLETAGGDWRAVHRDEVRLRGKGRLVLGPSKNADEILVLIYRCQGE